jgi:hypothetical protein
MTYQSAIIKQLIKAILERKGVHTEDDVILDELISRNIRRLNEGDKIAVDFDTDGIITAVRRINGFGCLHRLSTGAIVISYSELERYFNEQHSVSVEFSE